MNIVKGIDRIALVLAILIGFFAGMFFYNPNILWQKDNPAHGLWSKDNPEYKAWDKKRSARRKELIGNKFSPKNYDALQNDTEYQKLSQNRPPKYLYPHTLKRTLISIGVAIASFIVVLLFIRGTTRGLKWFFLWVIAGFKDEKKEHEK